MNIFIDTEFTDFQGPELISIGLVSDNDQKFYGERNDYTRDNCSTFVKEVVLPQLGKRPTCIFSKSGLREALQAWLMQFANEGVIICFDFGGDWQLFCDLLDYKIPTWITSMNVFPVIDDLLVERFFMENDVANHHALHDAMANRFACDRSET